VEITKTVSSRRPYSRLNSLSATTLSNKAPVAEGSTQVDKRLERFMNHRGRDAASLLAAYKASGDYSLLVEARNRFPTHPAVLAELSLGRFTYPAKFRRQQTQRLSWDPSQLSDFTQLSRERKLPTLEPQAGPVIRPPSYSSSGSSSVMTTAYSPPLIDSLLVIEADAYAEAATQKGN
jgi:hypothetical protein